MSRIDDLLSLHCPNGVAHVPLSSIVHIDNSGVDKKINENEPKALLLNYMDVYRNNYLDKSTLTSETSAKPEKIRSCSIRKGDVFVTPTSETRFDLGHASISLEDIPNAVYSYHLMRLRPKSSDSIDSNYLRLLFRSEMVQRQIIRLSEGITRFGLTKPKWGSIKIPLPPLVLQTEVSNFLMTIEFLQAELESELNARKSQFEYYRDQLLDFKRLEN